VPVAPQALSNRPIVLPAKSVISMSVAEGRETRVNCDMQTFADLQLGDLLEVSRADYTCRFLHPSGYSYYATLRSKLNWHEMPSLAPRL
jgi:NAD+ kinase